MRPAPTTDDLAGLPRTDVAGVDVGATKTHMRFRDPATGSDRTVEVREPGCASLEEMFLRCFAAAGCVPDRVVAGVAGRPEPGGDVQVTNRKGWPRFTRAGFERSLGLSLSVVNDMLASLAGVGQLDGPGLLALTPDVAPAAAPARVVASVGSGVGSSYLDAAGGMHGSETGHVPWQPVRPEEWAYLRHLQFAHPGVAVSVEQAIGGLAGFDHLYDHVSASVPAGDAVRRDVDRSRRGGGGAGGALTAGAIGGDACCLRIAELFGAVLGQYLRTLALCHLTGGGSLYLTSGVLQAPGFADHLLARTPFRSAFVGDGAEHAALMRTIPLYLVTDREVAVRGAYALARSWDGTGAPVSGS